MHFAHRLLYGYCLYRLCECIDHLAERGERGEGRGERGEGSVDIIKLTSLGLSSKSLTLFSHS